MSEQIYERLATIEWSGGVIHGCRTCPACGGVYGEDSPLWPSGASGIGHREDCWIYLALIDEDRQCAPQETER
jgi:hypothetical protein